MSSRNSSLRRRGNKREVVFDAEARASHLRGFSERKRQRRAYGLASQRVKDRKAKIEQRREEKKEEMRKVEEKERQKEELLEEQYLQQQMVIKQQRRQHVLREEDSDESETSSDSDDDSETKCNKRARK